MTSDEHRDHTDQGGGEPIRGCGKRVAGGLYLCVGLSAGGRPLEEFVIDPPRPWATGSFRSPILVPNPKNGATDAIMWIGAESYPYAPDFLEEARVMGISKRIPRTFPVGRLTPYASKIILVHPKAFPMIDAETPLFYQLESRKGGCRCDHPLHVYSTEEHCTFTLWNLSAYPELSTHDRVLAPTPGDDVIIQTPSVTYYAVPPAFPPSPIIQYHAGVVAAFWITHCEYIGEAVPEKIRETCGEIPVHPMPE